MCIIAYLKGGIKLQDDSILNRCWDKNPDGGGIMTIGDGKLIVFKTLFKDKWIEKLKELRLKYPDAPLVFHTRAASHGIVSHDNIHPFRVSKTMAFVHNGHINHCSTSKTDYRSDTNVFASTIVAKIADSIYNEGTQILLGDYIAHSKLVFLDVEQGVKITNEDKGEWDKDSGIWYSNSGYKAVTYYHGYRGGYYNYDPDDWTYNNKTHTKHCTNCNSDKSSLETVILSFNASDYIVRLKMCWTCYTKFKEDWKIENKGEIGKCYSCSFSAGAHVVREVDIEHMIVINHCSSCAEDLMFNPKTTSAVFNESNLEDALERVYSFYEMFVPDEAKEN